MNSTTKKKINENIFYMGLILITFIRLEQDSSIFNFQNNVVLSVKILAAICFGIKIITEKYEIKQIIVSSILLILALLTTVITKVPMVLLTIMMLIAIKGCDIRKTIKIIFYITTVILVVHTAFFTYNYITGAKEIEILNTAGRLQRYSFHFGHPNTLAAIMFAVILEWEYLYHNKVNKKYQIALVFISMILMYVVTKSRTSMIMFVLLLFSIIIIINNTKSLKVNKVLTNISNYIFPIISIAILIFLCTYQFIGDFWLDKLDDWSSRRTSTGIIAKEKYGINLFSKQIDESQMIEWKDKYITPMIIDSFYMHCFISYGTIYIIIISVAIVVSNKNNKVFDKICIILFSILGITEMTCFDVVLCITLLLIADNIWNKKCEKKQIKIITSIYRGNNKNAGPKAPKDIIDILEKEYNAKSICLKLVQPEGKKNIERMILQIVNTIKRFFFIFISCFGDEIIVLQHPFTRQRFILNMLPKNRTILFMHDCEAIRYNDDKEIENLKMFKYIVVHNESMKKFIEDSGINARLYTLELFDYLCNSDNQNEEIKINNDKIKIAYAGNLVKNKSPFVYQIDSSKISFELDLYGVGIDKDLNENVKYMGAEDPGDLPNIINANCGLIWDGNIDETDENEGFKNYTKYNNPHKLSCYIAAGVPVIAWKKSAIAKFIEKYNIGYTISNVYEINDINFNDYQNKVLNVNKLRKMVRKGDFTKQVINKVLNDIKKTNN